MRTIVMNLYSHSLTIWACTDLETLCVFRGNGSSDEDAMNSMRMSFRAVTISSECNCSFSKITTQSATQVAYMFDRQSDVASSTLLGIRGSRNCNPPHHTMLHGSTSSTLHGSTFSTWFRSKFCGRETRAKLPKLKHCGTTTLLCDYSQQ